MQLHTGKQLLFIKRLLQPRGQDYIVPADHTRQECKSEALQLSFRRFQLRLHAPKHLLLALGGADIFFAVPLPLLRNDPLNPLDFPHGILIVLLLHLALLFFKLLIFRIIPFQQFHMPVLHFHGAVGNAVKKITVMRNNQRGACEIAQEPLQPLHALNIQVVRRLVEQQKIGP